MGGSSTDWSASLLIAADRYVAEAGFDVEMVRLPNA